MDTFLIKNRKIDLTFRQELKNGEFKATKVFQVDSYQTTSAKETFKKFLFRKSVPVRKAPERRVTVRKSCGGLPPTIYKTMIPSISDNGMLTSSRSFNLTLHKGTN